MVRRFVGVVLALGVIFAVPVLAQTTEPGDAWPQRAWTDGVVVGPTLTTLSGNFVKSADHRWGIAAGLFGSYAFNRNAAARIEVVYVNRGALDVITTARDTISEIRVGYLSIPATVSLHKRLTRTVDLGVNFGLAVSFKAGSSILLAGESDPVPDSETTPGGRIRSVEWSLPLGAACGFYLPDARGVVTLEARYVLGLKRMLEENQPELYNRSWEFLIRYALRR